MIATISMELATYRELSERAFDLALTGRREEALAMSKEEIASVYDKIKTQLSSMIDSYKGDIDENRQRMLRESGSLQIGQILLALFSLPVACFIAWFSIR